MLPGTPARPAHRASSGGLALLVRQTVQQTVATATGQHRQPPARRRAARVRPLRRRPARPLTETKSRTYGRAGLPRPSAAAPQRLMRALAAAIVVSIVGLIGYFVVADEQLGHAGQPPAPTAPPAALAARSADPEPLSLDELFPDTEVRLVTGDAPYRVEMTHIDSQCETATTGELGYALALEGCTQVARAELIAPYGDYRVTAGVFNLAQDEGVSRVGAQVRGLVENGGGSFAAMSAGAAPGSAPRTLPDAQVGWHEYGHYLIYCVIARPDGGPLAADDPYAQRITADLLESYFAQQRLAKRA